MFTRQALLVLVPVLCLFLTSPAAALISGSSHVSNCGGEGGNWLDVSFTSPDAITLVSIEWDFSETSVWLDWDGDYLCTPENNGNIGYTFFYENGTGNNCQVFGADFTSFNSGDYFKVACDLDLGSTGCPLSPHFEGGVVTVTFSDGTILSAPFDEDYDYPNGSVADFSQTLLDMPNFTFVEDDPWPYPCLPRDDEDATWNSTAAPDALAGDAQQTWFSASVKNDGGVTAGPSSMAVYLDGEIQTSHLLWTITPGGRNGWVNDGPHSVRSGRHTLRVRADTGDGVTEFDETDNDWAHQWAWKPPVMSPGNVTRAAPPVRDADHEYLAGSPAPNCDGVRIQTDDTYPWTTLWVEALTDDAVDYRARLHPAYAGPEDGFTGVHAQSGNSESTRAVLLNARNIPSFLTLFDVGVVNYTGASATADYRAGLIRNSPYPIGFDIEMTNPVFATRVMSFEFHVGAGDLGPASLVFETNPEYGPIHVGWLAPDFTYGSLEDLNDPTISDGYGVAVINLDLTEAGYYCAYVYCNRDEHPGGLAVIPNIRHARPDLKPATPTGWCAPIVAQPHDESVIFGCGLPDTLHGDAHATWLNMTCFNGGSASTDTVSFLPRLDGDGLTGISNTWTTLAPGAMRQVLNFCYPTVLPYSIPGGRHTLTMQVDYLGWVDELTEVNNSSGRQYCWAPLSVPVDGTMTRAAVPDRTAGWEYCQPGTELYWNCDGLRLQYDEPGPQGYWRAVAAMPSLGSTDIDMQMHYPLEGVTGGFGPDVLAASESGPGEVEFTLVNYRRTVPLSFDVGVLDGPTNHQAGYVAQDAVSRSLTIPGSMDYLGTTMAAGRMLDLYDIEFAKAATWTITLNDGGSGVDWGLSLYDNEFPACKGKTDTVDEGLAQENGAGQSESLTMFLPANRHYCLAVWKVASGDLATEAGYNMEFWDGVSAAGDQELPAVTAITGAAPNPFNPSTCISFALPEAGPCRVMLLDVAGKKVRTLVQERLEAGRHSVTWDGRNDAGRPMASGVYVVSLEASGRSDRLKITLVK